jgi:hypothetical protein
VDIEGQLSRSTVGGTQEEGEGSSDKIIAGTVGRSSTLWLLSAHHDFSLVGWLLMHCIIACLSDLQQSRDVLIDQTVTCLALFALSTGQLSFAVDCSRYVLKRQEGYADAGIWIMRGLGFAAMGKGCRRWMMRCLWLSRNAIDSCPPTLLLNRRALLGAASLPQCSECE